MPPNSSASCPEQHTQNPRVILPHKTAFIVRHIGFTQTWELYIELSFQSLLVFAVSREKLYVNCIQQTKLRLYAAKHGTDFLHAICQCYWLVSTYQHVATNLSISLSCKKSVKIRLVATCQRNICRLVTRCRNNLYLKQTCNNYVDNLQQLVPTCTKSLCWQLTTDFRQQNVVTC